jgi:tetratricopeptide (TPR) repeat protein
MARNRKTASPASGPGARADLGTLEGSGDEAPKTGERAPEIGEAARSAESEPVSWLKRFAEWHTYYFLVPAALAFLVPLGGLRNGFAYDDKDIISNGLIKSLGNLPLAFTSAAWAFFRDDLVLALSVFYRPIVTCLWAFNYAVFGGSAWGWHLLSILIHVAVTFLVFVVLREVTDRKWLSGIAAILFAVHPVHVEAIAWASGVADALLALFALSSFYFYLRYRKEDRLYLLALSAGLYVMALFSKETALVLPLLIAFTELFYFDGSLPLRRRLVRLSTVVGVYLAPIAVYLVARYRATGALFVIGPARISLKLVIASAPSVILKYLVLLAWPSGYSIMHKAAPVESFASGAFLIPALVILLLVAGLVLARNRLLTFGAVWLGVCLIPSIVALVQFEQVSSVQDRYLYLASAGFCLAVAVGVESMSRLKLPGIDSRLAPAAATVVLATILSAVYIDQTRVWYSTISLIENCVTSDPREPLARTALASEYFVVGRRREAEDKAREALDLDRSCPDAYLDLGFFAHSENRPDRTIDFLDRAGTAIPDGPLQRRYQARVYHDLGLLYRERKDYDKAESNLRLAADSLPGPNTWCDLGDFYLERGRDEEARDLFERALPEVSLKYPAIHLKLARACDRLGQRDRARSEYERYIELAPNAPDAIDVIKRLSSI